MKRLWIHFPALLLLLALADGCSQPAAPQSAGAEKITSVKTVISTRERLSVPIQIPGTVATTTEARPAFKTGGVIARILVEEGQVVRKGQLLATLVMTEINAGVMQAAEGVAKAQRDLQRAKNLYADSVSTLEQVQNASTGLTLAEQSLQAAKFNQSYSEIRAPISGKVVRKLMNEGEIVGPGTPVLYLLGEAKQDWVIKAGLADRDWARLRLGDRAEVRLDAYPNQSFSAQVSQLADVGNPLSGTFDAEFKWIGTPPRLAIGLVAALTIFPRADAEYTLVPVDALVESNGSSATVFVVNPDQTVSKRNVTVGYLFQDKAVITSGLDGDLRIVTTGAAYLEDGNKIKIIQ